MAHFIYVFSDEGRDKLLAMQYELLKYDEQKHIYVFLNAERQDYACSDIPYALSDTLTF